MSLSERIVIVGSSGHAKVVIDLVEKVAGYEIVGLIDASREPGEKTLGYSVLGGEEELLKLAACEFLTACFVAIGDNYVRGVVAGRLRLFQPALRFVTLIHPSAVIGRDVEIGEGSVVMAGAVVSAASHIGRFCLLNTAAALDHESALDDFASLAPGARTGGNVRIGAYSAIGIGATLLHGVRVGEHSVIGAGATVLGDVDDYTVAYGSPARVIRQRHVGERYL